MKKLFLLIIAFTLTGCTYVGPFVTNISQNKDGTLTVEKCIVEHNIMGTVATKNCATNPV